MKKIENSVITNMTLYIGNSVEISNPSGGQNETWKTYYYAGAQRIAVRVKVSSNPSMLYYLFSDHLGSTSLTVNSAGSVIAERRYDAFGNARYQQGETPTDYQYTGQRFESNIGLYYYIPPGVQGLDRYAYVNNNPLKYTDPSGHAADCSQAPEGYARQQCERASANEQLYQAFLEEDWELFDSLLGIMLTTDGSTTWDTKTWNGVTFNEAVAVRRAAMDVAFALGSLNSGLTAAQAFRQAFGTSAEDRLEFRRVSKFTYDEKTYTAGGVTRNKHLIELANLSDYYFESARNNVVHELGHAFNNAHGGIPATVPGDLVSRRSEILQKSPDPFMKQLNKAPTEGETFADFFVAFTYNYWNYGSDRTPAARSWMMTNVAEWVH